MARYSCIGLMSGTSVDGVDLACCEFELTAAGVEWEIKAAETIKYSREWADRLLVLPKGGASELAKMNVDYGHYLGFLLRRFITQHQLKPDLVASHGHTIFHQPDKQFTMQIGDGQTIVTYLDCPLINDFRAKNVALGGKGAPLVPYGELDLFPNCELFLNLGGIANLSILPRTAELRERFSNQTWLKGSWEHLGYDICPCNMVLNHFARQYDSTLEYDPFGFIAMEGQVDPTLLEALEKHPFYSLKPPRTLSREIVEQLFVPIIDGSGSPLIDKMHTFTRHIALRIAAEISKFNLRGRNLLVTGGGAHNRYLMRMLEVILAQLKVSILPVEEEVIDFKEALCFAYLGLLAAQGRPNVLKTVTGARISSLCGAIHLPDNPEIRYILLPENE